MNLHLSQQCLILSNSSTEALNCHSSTAELNFLCRESLLFVLKVHVHSSNKLKGKRCSVAGQPGRGERIDARFLFREAAEILEGRFRLVEDWNENGTLNTKLKSAVRRRGIRISTLKRKSKMTCFNFQTLSEENTKSVFTELPSEVTAAKQCGSKAVSPMMGFAPPKKHWHVSWNPALFWNQSVFRNSEGFQIKWPL